MGKNGLDLGSFGAGVAAGQRGSSAEANREREMRWRAEQKLNVALTENMTLQRILHEANNKIKLLEGEIQDRWIPYAVSLKASLISQTAERDQLVPELGKKNAGIMDAINKVADGAKVQASSTGSENIEHMVIKESEHNRLAKVSRDEIDQAIRDKNLYLIDGVSPFDWADAFKLWSPIAESGDPQAQFNVARCYSLGIGVDKDQIKGFEWFLKAANQGDPRSYYNLSMHYERNKDAGEAVTWLAKAVELDEPRAIYRKAMNLLFDGDREKARELFKHAITIGYSRAELGIIGCDIEVTNEAGNDNKNYHPPVIKFRANNKSSSTVIASVVTETFDFMHPESSNITNRHDFSILQPGEADTAMVAPPTFYARVYLTGYTIWAERADGGDYEFFPFKEKLLAWEMRPKEINWWLWTLIVIGILMLMAWPSVAPYFRID